MQLRECSPETSDIGSTSPDADSLRYSPPKATDTGPAQVERGSPSTVTDATCCSITWFRLAVPVTQPIAAAEATPVPRTLSGTQPFAGLLQTILPVTGSRTALMACVYRAVFSSLSTALYASVSPY